MMIPTSKCFFFLNLMIWMHLNLIPYSFAIRDGNPNQVMAAKACQGAPDVPLCLDLLNAQPEINDLKQAAFVALQAASVEALQTSEFIKTTRDKEGGKEEASPEGTLGDCSQDYGSMTEIMMEASNSLSSGLTEGSDVSVDIKAAIAKGETCGKSINEAKKSPKAEEVAKKNEHVIKLFSNALSVYNVYASANGNGNDNSKPN
ncbi:hypothetical protein OSB04_022827 [Centaurea solstitialis]|uniref:Pectinesterase inhibitor domain-containing protein n=1 Tax=Centaurea solstitialis TaxID=347529 RepID=A0AA38SI04_9ASTR|nr:hypothetical protein OSB04_022827 [Centaurea solstitialis]